MAGSFFRGPLKPQSFYKPTVDTVAPVEVVPATGSLVLTGLAPTVPTPVVVTPGVRALTLTAYAPVVTTTVSKTGGSGVGSLPWIRQVQKPKPVPQPVLVSPPTAHLTLRTYAPKVWITQTLRAYAPTVTITRHITAEELFNLWHQEQLTTAEAMTAINQSRHNAWTGSIYRFLQNQIATEQDSVE